MVYSTPGVYFEWRKAGAPAILPERTDVAGFVGIAQKGPLHEPLRVDSWTEFTRTFGKHIPQGYLAYAVQGFFANGGQTCYVVRATNPSWAKKARLVLIFPERENQAKKCVLLTASSEGVWAHDLLVTVRFTSQETFTLRIDLPSGEQELWRDVTLAVKDDSGKENDNYIITVLNGQNARPNRNALAGSQFVSAQILDKVGCDENILRLTPSSTFQQARLKGGEDGVWTLEPEHLSGEGAPTNRTWGLKALEEISEVSIVAIPDLMPPKLPARRPRKYKPPRCDSLEDTPPPPKDDKDPDNPPVFSDSEIMELQQALVRHCERLKDRVALIHPKYEDRLPEDLLELRQDFDSSYAALYHPWLRMPDPLELNGILRDVPPDGHIAGVYARVETQTGPHQPPANKGLEAVQDVAMPIDNVWHGYFNDNSINVIKAYSGRGLRIGGARTLSSDSLWRYVNVRRLLIMIERSIRVHTQWIVFEPNNSRLWRDVDRVLRNFLDNLWRRGMLDGATADEAYSVTCDATTNPPEETNAGRLIAEVGVNPPWPAEFVIVRVSLSENGAELLEGTEVRRG